MSSGDKSQTAQAQEQQGPAKAVVPLPLNVVLVGEAGIGKSALALRFIRPTLNFTPGEYNATTIDDYNASQRVKDGFRGHHDVNLTVIDTGGQTELDRLRPLCYNVADVFILCFSVVAPSSFQALTTKWIPEIRRHSDQNILLVGTQSDLRSNTSVLLKLSTRGQSPVSETRAIRLSQKIGAKNYIECSAMTRKNIKQVFDYGMIIGLQKHEKIPMILANMENNLDSMIFTPETRVGGGPIRTLLGKENNIFLKQQRRVTKRLRKNNKIKRFLMSCLFH